MRILYHLPLSPFARKVRLVLAEKRLPFELRSEKVWARRPEFLELNPACTVPTLVEDNGLVIPDSAVICEYLDEAYPDMALLGRTLGERVETRRLVSWFDGKFNQEVLRNLYWEKTMKQNMGIGAPEAAALRAGSANLKTSFKLYRLGWRKTGNVLAGANLSLADFAAAAYLSTLDYMDAIDWSASPPRQGNGMRG